MKFSFMNSITIKKYQYKIIFCNNVFNGRAPIRERNKEVGQESFVSIASLSCLRGLPSTVSLPKDFSIDDRLCLLKISSMNDLRMILFLFSIEVTSGEDIRYHLRRHTIYLLKLVSRANPIQSRLFIKELHLQTRRGKSLAIKLIILLKVVILM